MASPPTLLDQYDIVICGGGTAGCVLAARLSEDPSVTVLLLEAGGNENENPLVATPGLFPANLDNPQVDWGYVTEPSPGLNGRRIAQPRGKCLGGSSAINIMVLIYPSKAGMDMWAEMGNPGWDWDNMAPYYRKFQTRHLPSEEAAEALGLDFVDPLAQGTTGPIASSFPSMVSPIQTAWTDSWKSLQKWTTGDPLAGIHVGGYSCTASINPKTGERSHAGNSYYAPAAKRPNLHLVTGALIEKVELDASDPKSVKATGVTFTHSSGSRFTATASREVILTAGAFGSPALLERSGIGGREVLSKAGITPIVTNDSVGENLQDHILAGCSYEVADGILTLDATRDPEFIQAAMAQYQKDRTGPLANAGSYSFASTPLVDYVTSVKQEELEKLYDQYLPSTTTSSSSKPPYLNENHHHAFTRRMLESPNEATASMCFIGAQARTSMLKPSDVFAIVAPENYVSILTALAHPFSRGAVHIQDKDARTPPRIDGNYLEHPLDLEIFARHLMQIETIASSAPLKPFLKQGGRRIPEQHDALTLENAKRLAQECSMSNYHPAGTCAMLPLDLGGVVNPRLLVYGTKNLRVCDASVFPIEPRGNIQSTVYAVAEKGADIIKQDLGLRSSSG